MLNYECEGQIDFNDYFQKPKLDINPKQLVHFINNMGIAQYTQIGNVIKKTVETNRYKITDEEIDRITNSVSVWLLGVGSEYEKYLKKLIN